MKVREEIQNDLATGLRDITLTTNEGTIETRYVHDEIYIKNTPGENKFIRVNYTKYQMDTNSGLQAAPKKLTYKLTDILQVDEYEVDENGDEVDGTRVTVVDEKLYLTDWDSHVGMMFSVGIIKAIKEINGIID